MYLKHLFQQSFSYNTMSKSSSISASSQNAISLYFQRSQLISSIKHTLNSNAPLESLASLVNTPLLDSFVVSRALRYAPSADSALLLMKTLKKVPHFSHTQTTVKALAMVLAKFQRFSELQGLIDSIRNFEYFPGVSTENIDMDEFLWYAASGDVNSVLRLWDKTKGHRFDRRCIKAYNVLMGVHAKASNNFEAVKVFYKMMEENAVPNSRTYTTMIEHLVSSGKLDSAIEVFHILPRMRIRRSSRMYAALLKGLVDARQFEIVSDLKNEMQIDGVILPLRQCSHEEDEDEDAELASKIKFEPEILSALDDTNVAWTSALVCKTLWRMVNRESVDNIWAFYCWLGNKSGRFTHDAYTASTMLKILSKRCCDYSLDCCHSTTTRPEWCKDDLVDELITKIKEDGMSLSYITLNYIIDRHCHRTKGVVRIFGHAEEICKPLSKFHLMILYSSLIRQLTHNRSPLGALDMLEDMIFRGFLPDIQTFTGLMYYFSRKRDLLTVVKLFQMVQRNNLKPDAFMFQILIRAYLRCGKVDRAFKVFQDMRDSNLMPDVATKALLVKYLSKEGKSEEVAIVEAGSEEINHLPPLPLHAYIWNVSSFDLKRVYDIYYNSF